LFGHLNTNFSGKIKHPPPLLVFAFRISRWDSIFLFSAVLQIIVIKHFVLLGIENFEFILVTFTGTNVIMAFQKRLFLTHLTFLNGYQVAKKKDDSPSLLIRLKIRFLLSILLKK
jgi:hypothetical protein